MKPTLVVSVGESRGLMEMVQGIGRLARAEGMHGYHLLVSSSERTAKNFEQFHSEIMAGSSLSVQYDTLQSFLINDLHKAQYYTNTSGECLREILNSYCDGKESSQCLGGTDALCSACIRFLSNQDLNNYEDKMERAIDKLLFRLLLRPLAHHSCIPIDDSVPSSDITSLDRGISLFSKSSDASLPQNLSFSSNGIYIYIITNRTTSTTIY